MDEGGSIRTGAVVAGAVFAVLGVVALVLLPRGAAEFAYFPMDLSWPWGLGRGVGVAELGAHGVGVLLFGPAVGLLAWGFAPRLPVLLPDIALTRRIAWGAGITSVCLATLALLVVGGRPLVPDELSYASQARQLVRGMILAPVPDGYTVEAFDIVAPAGGGVTAKYLPGEALVQAPGVLVGLPALLHLPLLALALWAVWRAARLHAGDRVATVILAMVALSPMLVLVTGTGLSHTAAFAAIAVAAWGEALIVRERPWLGGLLIGLGVAAAAWIRPQVAAPVGGIFVLFGVWRLFRCQPLALLALCLPLIACVGGVALYDVLVTGHPLRLPWSVSGEAWGFGRPFAGVDYVHGPGEGVQNLITNSVRFSTWWIGWPSGFVLLWMYLRVGKPLGSLWSWPVAAAAQLAFMIPYYAPGIYDVGPIYHLEAILGASALGGLALVGLWEHRPRFASALAAVWIVVGVLPVLLWGGARLDRLLDHVHWPADAALAALPDGPTLVLAETDCTGRLGLGSMLISFPGRSRLRSAHTIIVPRPPPQRLDAFIAAWGERTCVYVHRDETRAVQVLDCAAARAFLERPQVFTEGLASCPRETSFAEQLGWHRPPIGGE